MSAVDLPVAPKLNPPAPLSTLVWDWRPKPPIPPILFVFTVLPRLCRLPVLPNAPPPPKLPMPPVLPNGAPPTGAPPKRLLEEPTGGSPVAGAAPNAPTDWLLKGLPAAAGAPKGLLAAAGAPKGLLDAAGAPKRLAAAGAKAPPPKAGAALARLLLLPNVKPPVEVLPPSADPRLELGTGAAGKAKEEAGAPNGPDMLPDAAPPKGLAARFELLLLEKDEEKGLPLMAGAGAAWLEKLPVSIVEPGESIVMALLLAPMAG